MKNEKNEVKRVTFQIPDELYEDVVRASMAEDRSVSSFIRQAIVNMVAAHGR